MNALSSPGERLAGPEGATGEEVAAFVIAAAVWAPSVHNTQPWWFCADGQEISLFADATRQLMVADPGGREMMISWMSRSSQATCMVQVIGPSFPPFSHKTTMNTRNRRAHRLGA